MYGDLRRLGEHQHASSFPTQCQQHFSREHVAVLHGEGLGKKLLSPIVGWRIVDHGKWWVELFGPKPLSQGCRGRKPYREGTPQDHEPIGPRTRTPTRINGRLQERSLQVLRRIRGCRPWSAPRRTDASSAPPRCPLAWRGSALATCQFDQALARLEEFLHSLQIVEYPQGIEPDTYLNSGLSALHRPHRLFGYAEPLGKNSHGVVAPETCATQPFAE